MAKAQTLKSQHGWKLPMISTELIESKHWLLVGMNILPMSSDSNISVECNFRKRVSDRTLEHTFLMEANKKLLSRISSNEYARYTLRIDPDTIECVDFYIEA